MTKGTGRTKGAYHAAMIGGGFTRGSVGWSGVVWTVDERWTEVDGTTVDCWADLGWETPKLERKCESGGVVSLLLGCSLISGDESEDSKYSYLNHHET